VTIPRWAGRHWRGGEIEGHAYRQHALRREEVVSLPKVVYRTDIHAALKSTTRVRKTKLLPASRRCITRTRRFCIMWMVSCTRRFCPRRVSAPGSDRGTIAGAGMACMWNCTSRACVIARRSRGAANRSIATKTDRRRGQFARYGCASNRTARHGRGVCAIVGWAKC